MKLITKLYYNSIGIFIEGARLYKLDLMSFNEEKFISCNLIPHFQFYMPNEKDLALFAKLYENIPGKTDKINQTFESGNYLCFAYIDTINNRLAYTRWLCKNEYYSEAMRKNIKLNDNEALTLDSYTHPDYRMLGLHKQMNVQMLGWLKKNTHIRYIYMVILIFVPHLTKIPLELGYRPVESTFYYKKGSSRVFMELIKRKLNVKII